MRISDADTQQLQRRLARINGQVGGVRTMLAQGRHSLEICDQIEAIMGGLQAVQWALAREILRGRAMEAVQSGDATRLESGVIELYARQPSSVTRRKSEARKNDRRPGNLQVLSNVVRPPATRAAHLFGLRARPGGKTRE